ncbi:uncharacterized protein [Temnothorax longispinosus]|uniref:uncharacterized protein isoform X2 n=1 Tax=Temnothorax longispinosus TaxID=300112 RepID=UPI003A9A14F7
MDESDSNDSDSGLSDIENTTKTTTKTYDGEINEGEPSGIFNKIASRRTIRDFQQDEDVDEPDTSSDISYLDDNMENDQNVVNVKRKMNQNRKLKDSQQRNKKSTHTWTPDEKRVVLDAFDHYIHSTDKKLPTFSEIRNLIQKHKDLLGHRKVPAIKTWVRNQKQKYKKRMEAFVLCCICIILVYCLSP